MNDTTIVALLSFIGTLVGSGAGILTSAKLTNFRLKKLEESVAEHNNFARKMPVIEEKISVINNRLKNLEGAAK